MRSYFLSNKFNASKIFASILLSSEKNDSEIACETNKPERLNSA